jgi:TonB family protein
MNEFALYLLKSACWLTGFALIYFIFLRNERFFMLKRIFLVSGILVSLLFPFISFHYSVELPMPLVPAFNPVEEILPISSGIQNKVLVNNFDFMHLLLIVYLAGLFVIAARMIYHIYLVFKAIFKHDIYNKDSAMIIRASEYPSSFSFFNYVFINPSVEEGELREIINHELVHVKQKHWLDLLLIEFLRMIQWANPFAWIYTGFIRLNHEYLADEAALQRSSDPALYKAALLNHMFRSRVFSLSNSFNYSFNKNRFEMMKKIITSPYRKLKVLLIVPVFAILFYAFSNPEYKYSDQNMNGIETTDHSITKEVKGIVLKEDGKPFQGVHIAVTRTEIRGTTDVSGNFTLTGVPEGSHLVFSYRGHLTQVLKPFFSQTMTIKLLKDPEYPGYQVGTSLQNALVVIDDVISEKPYAEVMKEIDINQIARLSVIKDKETLDKYAEKGKNGVVEIMTRKKAAELGIKVPIRRQNPEDFPTFHGETYLKFANWLADRIKYPVNAAAKGIEGRVSVNYLIRSDGSIGDVKVFSAPDPSLGDVVVKAVNESPRWEAAKNPESTDPFSTSVTLKFELPDKIKPDDTFVMVEQMPEYPGGSQALLDFINNNLKYPYSAKADKTEGRVIVRFIVNAKGHVEDAVVLKGVHPLLDAEALRVVNLLSGWMPGAEGGKPVNVWYMLPVTFTLTPEEKGITSPEASGEAPLDKPEQMPKYTGGKMELFKFIAENTNYPEAAKTQKIEGTVVVRFIVNTEGHVENAVVLEGVHPSLDAEALRVVNLLKGFTPGSQGGKLVNAYYTVHISFGLNPNNK